MLPKKLLGQNFLVDEGIASRIVDAVGINKGDTVVEVGPGRGILTEKILDLPCKLLAVELDRRLHASLEKRLGNRERLKLVRGDFLSFDLRLAAGGGKLKLVGNLPYRITGPVMRKVVDDREVVDSAVFMVQKEVADRLCASAGRKSYGPLSIFVQVYAEVEKVLKVSAKSFKPQPKVASGVVRLRFRPTPLVKPQEEAFFFWLVRTAFTQRRKMLVNSLSAGLKIPKSEVEEKLSEVGLGKHSRPEEVDIRKFVKLALALNSERSRQQ